MLNRKKTVLAAAVAFCMLLSGCVYLRLLEVKNQLAKFDEFFSVEVTDSFTLHLKQPVIYDEDILYLTELDPSRIDKEQENQTFVYQFEKVETTPIQDNQDLIFSIGFNKDKKLDRIVFSPVILQIVPAKFLELSIRSVGHGKIDKVNRQLKGDVEKVAQNGLVIPTYQSMINVLGKPYEEFTKEDGHHAIFRYLLKTETTGEKAENRKKAIIDMRFDPKTKQLIKVAGNFAGMKISVNYSGLVKPDEK